MENPLVSIVIPVYNGANYLREAIDSALAQTYQNIEVIVVNDGSNDDGRTDAIARSYGERIRYYMKTNGGVSSALNVGIQNMRGEYFSWLSHDDLYEREKIAQQVEQLKDVNNRILLCCQCSHIDEQSEEIKGYFPKSGFRKGVYKWQDSLLAMLRRATLNGCCLMIPREAFEICGGFDESLRFSQDVVMWYKMFLAGYSLYYTEKRLVRSRVHSKQLTQTGQALFRKECYMISEYLMSAFVQVSNPEYNFLKVYLLSDSRYLPVKQVSKIVSLGKQAHLLSASDIARAYCICGYGKIRPLLRKIYYLLFRRMKTR